MRPDIRDTGNPIYYRQPAERYSIHANGIHIQETDEAQPPGNFYKGFSFMRFGA